MYLFETTHKAADGEGAEPQVSAFRNKQDAEDFVSNIVNFAQTGEETIIRLKVIEF